MGKHLSTLASPKHSPEQELKFSFYQSFTSAGFNWVQFGLIFLSTVFSFLAIESNWGLETKVSGTLACPKWGRERENEPKRKKKMSE
jgi:hypothetical protein